MIPDDENSNRYVTFIQELCAELQTLYEKGGASEGGIREETIREKERIISAAKERFEEEYESRFTSDNYRGFVTLPVNNAYLELYRLYYAEDDYFSQIYAQSGKSLRDFIAAAKTMPKKAPKGGGPKSGGREMLEKALGLSFI
jgi:predicted aminopeptidase